MISKERLEELIGQKKSVYWKFAKIKPSSWSKYTIMGNTIVKGNLKEMYSLDDLFETKEDFEWHRQFGCITRTERLKLPTWEELNNILQTQKYFEVNFKNKYETVSFCVNECQIAVMQQGHNYLSGLDKEFNKENYILACRKCKELFLGEGESCEESN